MRINTFSCVQVLACNMGIYNKKIFAVFKMCHTEQSVQVHTIYCTENEERANQGHTIKMISIVALFSITSQFEQSVPLLWAFYRPIFSFYTSSLLFFFFKQNHAIFIAFHISLLDEFNTCRM